MEELQILGREGEEGGEGGREGEGLTTPVLLAHPLPVKCSRHLPNYNAQDEQSEGHEKSHSTGTANSYVYY